MTSRTEQGAAPARDDRAKGVGRRLLSRMKTVLKKADPSKRASTMSAPAPLATASRRYSAAPGPTLEQTVPAASQPLVESAPQESSRLLRVDDEPVPAAAFEAERIPRSQIYTERAKHLSDYHGLEMDPYIWYQMEGTVLRVHKSAHVRVHRTCHQCGHDRNKGSLCENCSHKLCRQCPRYPPKRTDAELSASRDHRSEMLKERAANAIIVPDWRAADPRAPVVLRRPARPSGGGQQELVYKKVRQRVRRTCCQCLELDGAEVLFQSGGRFCNKCDHARCTDCPRDPPKKDKYPYGYPGDEFGAKSIPHYRCHECLSKFPGGVQNGTPCLRCSHEKCDDCERLLPQKVEPEPDPEVLRSVQEKLAAFQLR